MSQEARTPEPTAAHGAARFVIVPQWQASVSSRALRLIDGAEAIRGDLPASATRSVSVPMEAGESLGTGVLRFSSILHTHALATAALSEISGTAIVIGGDCGIELAAVEHAIARHANPGGTVAVIWFDAHPDLHSPESSPSGAFTGMVLRAILGDGPAQLVSADRIQPRPDQIVLAGVRSSEPAEEEFAQEAGIRALPVEELADPGALIAAVQGIGASAVYLHIGLDVLDPGAIFGLDAPVPFGLQLDTLCQLIKALRGSFPLAGAGLAGFAPESPAAAVQDLPAILRILGALTAPLP
ncbi:MAG: arginase family protein [Microbacteriaceae bacterium]